MSSRDLLYNIVLTVNNNVLYTYEFFKKVDMLIVITTIN